MTIKVRELILALQTFDQEMNVMIQDISMPLIAHPINSTLKQTPFVGRDIHFEDVVVLTTEN